MLVVEPRYLRHVRAIAPTPVKPEKRLELAVLCSWSLVISMFWFGWTSSPDVHWISPVLALCLLGIAMLGLFVSLYVALGLFTFSTRALRRGSGLTPNLGSTISSMFISGQPHQPSLALLSSDRSLAPLSHCSLPHSCAISVHNGDLQSLLSLPCC